MDRWVADAELKTHGNASGLNVAGGKLIGYAEGGTEIFTDGRSNIF
jgi:hypothetical protein